MGSLRRGVSVVDVLAHAGARDGSMIQVNPPEKWRAGGAVTGPKCTPKKLFQDHELWKELAEVDCGCCVLSFRSFGPALPDVACLQIRLSSRKQPRLKWLLTELARVLNFGVDFVVTYDFRSQSPVPSFTEGLADFWKQHREQCAGHLKSTALLVKDSIFDTATQSGISCFIQACALGSPFVVCHGEAAAEEFFKAGASRPPRARDAADVPFVSVVDVQAAPQHTAPQGAGAFLEPSCIASLAPLRRRAGRAEDYSEAHTFHMLPNGDVRVIQSPPRDVVLRMDTVSTEGEQAGQRATTEPPRPDSHAASRCTSSAVAALKFECPREQLQTLIGAHFHLGELVIDAEIESASRCNPRRSSKSGNWSDQAATAKGAGGCFGGMRSILCKIVSFVLPPEEEMPPSSPYWPLPPACREL